MSAADGSWNTTVNSPMGAQKATLTIKTDGATFTGTMAGAQGNQEVSGKVDGNTLTWGSKLTQNICEGVSRMIVSQAMIRIKKKYGIRTLNWPYDELLLLIPKDGREEEMLQLCIAEMVREPSWLPGIPLAAEGALGERYEK